jgi:hypothetical protein
MRWLALALVAAAACGSTTTTPDLAVVPSGCRAPAFCFQVTPCDCRRASVQPGGSCINCDPTTMAATQQCDCPADGGSGLACLEPAQVCVGQGKLCAGFGARCVDPTTIPAGKTACDAPGGEPPMPVEVADGGVGTESRCAFVDDECCPGEPDMGVPDLGSPPDGGPGID